ncbi:MAG: cupin domain-containing protein [Chloroflexota bacterium]
MIAHELVDIQQQHQAKGQLWHEFLRVPDLSMGLYVIPAGGTDPQQPHSEDEVYYVVSGAGQIHVAGDEKHIQPGSIVYVAAQDRHYFHSVEEDLQLLVFFAPAEASRSNTQ